jgi:matrixin
MAISRRRSFLAVTLAVTLTGAWLAFGSDPAEAGGGLAQDECVTPEGLELQDQDYEDDQLPWQRPAGTEVVVYFETRAVTDEAYLDDLAKAVEAWDRSPCLQPRLIENCPDGENCVTISLVEGESEDDGNFDAIEEGDFTIGGHIDYYVDNLAEEGPLATLNVVIHEMGHAVGLRHRATEGVLMHADTNETIEPDEIDYENLLVLYGNQK